MNAGRTDALESFALDVRMRTERLNGTASISVSDAVALPLSRSPRLAQVSQQMQELSSVYGREPMRLNIGGTPWRFRWVPLSDPIAGVALRLRIGGAPVSIVLDDLRVFGPAVDVMRPELPEQLRTACMIEWGAAVWAELETITRRTVELVDVRPHVASAIALDGLGFEIEHEARRVVARGFVRCLDAGLQRTLIDVSRREMPRAPVRADTSIRWTAVVGSTRLPGGDVRALEEHDIVVIDDAVYSAEALECWLGAGPTRRFAGRVSLRTGRLHLIDFTLKGSASMSARDADERPAPVSGFDEIPVSLRFEVAQWQASLGDIAALAPGAIVDLGQRVDAQSVTVWVEQRCIGTGQLVAIGERLGVRLLSVFDGRSAATALTSASTVAPGQNA